MPVLVVCRFGKSRAVVSRISDGLLSEPVPPSPLAGWVPSRKASRCAARDSLPC